MPLQAHGLPVGADLLIRSNCKTSEVGFPLWLSNFEWMSSVASAHTAAQASLRSIHDSPLDHCQTDVTRCIEQHNIGVVTWR